MRCSVVVKMLSTALLVPYICGLCYGFVLLGGGVKALDADYFAGDNAWLYQFTSKTLTNEKSGAQNKSVGFYIQGDVLVESVWTLDKDKLLRIEFQSPELHIKSRKVPETDDEGFIKHSSMLDHLENHAFYVLWRDGTIDKVLIDKKEPLSLANFKKGVASLLQFQILDVEKHETDASGKCLTTYKSRGPKTIIKSKRNCKSDDFKTTKNPRPLLSTSLESSIITEYTLGEDHLVTIESKEKHVAHLAAKEDIGSEILVEQILQYKETRKAKNPLRGKSFAEILQVINNRAPITEESLTSEMEHAFDDKKSFHDSVTEHRDQLKVYGTLQSSQAFIKLVQVARRSGFEDISKTLKSKNNKKILEQLYDVLGYTQTSDSHEAAMKHLHFDDAKKSDLSERYLWALSISSQPNVEIIVDLLNKYKKTHNIPVKVKETLILSIASMAKYRNLQSTTSSDRKIHEEVERNILNYLEASKDEEERYHLLRALINLESPSTLEVLTQIAVNGKPKETVIAWKAIHKMKIPPNEKLQKTASRTYLNLDKDYDTSARTIALDVLLESKPNDEMLSAILNHLTRECGHKEVQQYAIQRLQMWIEENDEFAKRITRLITSDPRVNNYHILSRRGLSVAMARSLYSSGSSNGTLSTVQEIQSGQVKRGIVSVNLERKDLSEEIFALGMFSSGLGNFMQSTDGSDDTMMGGMELSILGTQVRPFVFFNGQGELMGHVWSGTGSERTTAFQALIMLHDHREFLRLGNGFIAELDVKSGASFDLSGQIEISIWYRNANSYIEKSAGVLIMGGFKVDSAFVRSQVDFSVAFEPKLELSTYVDFSSSNVNLCMRLQQPESQVKHNVYKIERIPGSKHKLREHIYRRHFLPGKTYALNRKNSDMCNAIHS